jgi:hypothetical protein
VVELDNVRLSDQTDFVVPQRERLLDTHTFGGMRARMVNVRMERTPPQSVKVFVERLLDMNEPALTRAIRPVLESGNLDRIKVSHATIS